MQKMKKTYDQPLGYDNPTNIFEVNHEDAYDSDVDEGPNAAAAFMANLSSTSATNSQVNEVNVFFINVQVFVRCANDLFVLHAIGKQSLKRRYDELSKANTHSRTAYTEKINALTAENAKLKTELSGKKSGGSTASEKPKVPASGMYTKSSKYIPLKKEANLDLMELLRKEWSGYNQGIVMNAHAMVFGLRPLVAVDFP
ncbi:hypothetical protein Tco_1033063 [Tanacetum coccineum]|uniref:Uncharacterized protein n=1 Tax=Tanacetum coccineum TaxID=301880 RepID=A0ABQ5GFW7_9ASTR